MATKEASLQFTENPKYNKIDRINSVYTIVSESHPLWKDSSFFFFLMKFMVVYRN